MSIYNGKLSPLGRLVAEVVRRSPVANADISAKTEVSADIETVKTMEGGISRAGKFFGGSMLRIAAVFRFIGAKCMVFIGRKAGASAAPSTPINVGSRIFAKKRGSASAHDTTAAKVESRQYSSSFAGLHAYIRAAVAYIKHIFMVRKAELSAASGVVIRYLKAMKLNRSSKAEAAESAIMESRFNRLTAERKAAASSVSVEETASARATPVELTANASRADVIDANVQTEPGTAHAAKMATWFYPEVVDGVLILRQVYSATVENDVLVVS